MPKAPAGKKRKGPADPDVNVESRSSTKKPRASDIISASTAVPGKENNAPPQNQRPQRSTRGQGGAVAQLAQVSESITHQKRAPKSTVNTMPESVTRNPMAPPAPKRRGRPPKGTQDTAGTSSSRRRAKSTNAAIEIQTDAEQRPLFLVPPGTEPTPYPPTPVSELAMQIAEANRRNMPVPVDSTPLTHSFPSSGFNFRASTSAYFEPSSTFHATPTQHPQNQENVMVLGNSGCPTMPSASSSSQSQPVVPTHLDLRDPPSRSYSAVGRLAPSENHASTSRDHSSSSSIVDYNVDPKLRHSAFQPASQPLQIAPQPAPQPLQVAPQPAPQRHFSLTYIDAQSTGSTATDRLMDGPGNLGHNANGHQELREGDDSYGGNDDFTSYNDNGNSDENMEEEDEDRSNIGNEDEDNEDENDEDDEDDDDEGNKSEIDGDNDMISRHHVVTQNNIDEISPDEDDQNALRILRMSPQRDSLATRNTGPPEPGDDNDGSFDVLEDHHRRNRRYRPPNTDRLRDYAEKQRQNQHRSKGMETSNQEDLSHDARSDSSESSEPLAVKKRAARHSQTPYSHSRSRPKPTRLGFYPSQWTDVLEKAKRRFHLFLATDIPFPNRDDHFSKAEDFISEAIDEHQKRGGQLENGYFPTHFKSMATLVYEEHSTFRGRLRDIAREIVKQHYDLFPASSPNSPPLSQRSRRSYTSERVTELLGNGGLFLQNGVDEQGSTNNLTHPALDALCFEFFYSSDDSLGNLFPREFQTVPVESYALACTVLHHCLKEWSTGSRQKVSFTGDENRPVYNAMMALIRKTSRDRHHGPKLQATLRRIADEAREARDNQAEATDYGFDVILD